jgi:hypothetical protein
MAARAYLGMRPGDLDGKRFAPYWNPDMAPLSVHVREALLHGPEASELGLPLDDVNHLLDAGDLAIENGWRRASGQRSARARDSRRGRLMAGT